MSIVEQVLLAGPSKCSVRIAGSLQVDLRIVRDDRYGAALMYFTGSKQYNVALRKRAINTDMHGPADLDQMRYGVIIAQRGWAEPKHIVSIAPDKSGG